MRCRHFGARALVLATLLLLAASGCNDLRDFRGTWQGARVGDQPVLRVGPGDAMTLSIDDIDSHGLAGRVAIDGLGPEVAFESLPGAEADALASMTFAGSPLRVYVAIVTLPDGKGDAFVLIALYPDERIEARVLRRGETPIYGIFTLAETV